MSEDLSTELKRALINDLYLMGFTKELVDAVWLEECLEECDYAG